VGMLIEQLQAAIKETHDPLLKECLNEIIRLNQILIENEISSLDKIILEMEQKNDKTHNPD
jgi:hypothetical protein